MSLVKRRVRWYNLAAQEVRMSLHLESLLDHLRRHAGEWVDLRTLSSAVHLPHEKVAIVLETARKTGKGVQRRGGQGRFEFRLPKPTTLERAPVVATAPVPTAPGNGNRYALVKPPHATAPPPATPPTRPGRRVTGFKLRDAAHVPPGETNASTAAVRSDTPPASPGTPDPSDYVVLMDLAENDFRKYQILAARARHAKVLIHVPNPRAGQMGQRHLATAVLRTDLAKIAGPVGPPRTSPKPAAPPAPPAVPAVAPPPAPSTPSSAFTPVNVRSDLITRLTRVSLTVQSPITELVNVAIDEWLRSLESK